MADGEATHSVCHRSEHGAWLPNTPWPPSSSSSVPTIHLPKGKWTHTHALKFGHSWSTEGTWTTSQEQPGSRDPVKNSTITRDTNVNHRQLMLKHATDWKAYVTSSVAIKDLPILSKHQSCAVPVRPLTWDVYRALGFLWDLVTWLKILFILLPHISL